MQPKQNFNQSEMLSALLEIASDESVNRKFSLDIIWILGIILFSLFLSTLFRKLALLDEHGLFSWLKLLTS